MLPHPGHSCMSFIWVLSELLTKHLPFCLLRFHGHAQKLRGPPQYRRNYRSSPHPYPSIFFKCMTARLFLNSHFCNGDPCLMHAHQSECLFSEKVCPNGWLVPCTCILDFTFLSNWNVVWGIDNAAKSGNLGSYKHKLGMIRVCSLWASCSYGITSYFWE